MMIHWLRALKRFDDRRPSVPGEHWLTAGTGLALLKRSRHRGSPLTRGLTLLLGGALLLRGLSGRDGLAGRLRRHLR